MLFVDLVVVVVLSFSDQPNEKGRGEGTQGSPIMGALQEALLAGFEQSSMFHSERAANPLHASFVSTSAAPPGEPRGEGTRKRRIKKG